MTRLPFLLAMALALVSWPLAAQQANPPNPAPQAIMPRDMVGLKPLCDMTADDRYQGEEGGLYGGGKNTPPDAHRAAAEKELAKVELLDKEGMPDPKGRIVFVSISMSNATREFSTFKLLADADDKKSLRLQIIDCAQNGQGMAEWAVPNAPAWREMGRRLALGAVTNKQVQVAWVKLANENPHGNLQEHGKQLYRDTLAVLQNAKERFPNLRIVYLASRTYGGYATGGLNPEPYAYESGFVARWLIRDQMRGDAELNYDASRGEVKTPLLLWGPYLWADGVSPRSDGLVYKREDFAADGVHPTQSGREKVAKQLLEFFKTNPLAKSWCVCPE